MGKEELIKGLIYELIYDDRQVLSMRFNAAGDATIFHAKFEY